MNRGFRLGLLLFGLVSFGQACFTAEENKLYVLAPGTFELHVLNATDLSPILFQPLDFSEVGRPIQITLNPAFHQLYAVLENSNELIRIGTESPFDYKPLVSRTFGDADAGEVIVAVQPNSPQESALVLTTFGLSLIDEFGSPKTLATATPTPTATPSPTATPTATPTTRTLDQGMSALANSVSLNTGCDPSALALNVSVENVEDESSGDSSEDDDDETPDSAGDFVTAQSDFRLRGGTWALVACQGSDEVRLYDANSLSLYASFDLNDGAAPFHLLFARSADERGSTVTGAFGVWNDDGTLEVVRVSESSASLSSAGPIALAASGLDFTAFGANTQGGLLLTAFIDATGAWVDLRDTNGSVYGAAPYALEADCAVSGASGIFADQVQIELTTAQKNAGYPDTDILVYYACPDTGMIGILSTNTGSTFWRRDFGADVVLGPIVPNFRTGELLVGLQGSTSPAPGVMVLKNFTLEDALFPSALTFGSGGAPEVLLVNP